MYEAAKAEEDDLDDLGGGKIKPLNEFLGLNGPVELENISFVISSAEEDEYEPVVKKKVMSDVEPMSE